MQSRPCRKTARRLAKFGINIVRLHQLDADSACPNIFNFTRLGKKAHFISEWDAPWPNHYRAEAPIFVASLAAFQGSSGMTVHTYRYGSREDEYTTGRLGRNVVIGGSYYRGTFDTYNDPAKFGLFYHAGAIWEPFGDVHFLTRFIFCHLAL